MTANQDFNSNNHSQNELNIGGTVRSAGLAKASEFSLTQDQMKQLLKFLPAGYSFLPAKSSRQSIKRMPSHVFTVDDSRGPSLQVEKKKREAYYKAEQKLKEPVEFLRRCERIMSLLKTHDCAEWFMEPVDPQCLGIPDYFEVIKEPMDFSKVEKRLRSGYYKNSDDFDNDIRKIWNNATTYNHPKTEIYGMTLRISSYFEKLVKEDDPGSKDIPAPKAASSKVGKKSSGYSPSDEAYRPPKSANVQSHTLDKPLSYMEKKALSDMIRQLPAESLWEVWGIVSPNHQGQSESIEFDIDTLSAQTARRLESFVKSKLQSINKKPKSVKGTFKEPALVHSGSNGWNNPPNPAPDKISPGVGQPRENLNPPTADTRNLNNNSSDSSFLSDLSDSDE